MGDGPVMGEKAAPGMARGCTVSILRLTWAGCSRVEDVAAVAAVLGRLGGGPARTCFKNFQNMH